MSRVAKKKQKSNHVEDKYFSDLVKDKSKRMFDSKTKRIKINK